MDFDTLSNAMSSAMSASRAVQSRTTSATQTSVNTQATTTEVIVEEKSLVEEIREKGFQTFVDELKAEKIKLMREEILRAMGLDEERLAAMPAEQRAQIEKMVNQEIIERMVASAEMNGENGTLMAQFTRVDVQVTQVQMTTTLAAGTGLGPLLALQEQDAIEQHILPHENRNDG